MTSLELEMLAATSAVMLVLAFECHGEMLLVSQHGLEYETAGHKRNCWFSVTTLETNSSVDNSNAESIRVLDDMILDKIKLEIDDNIRKTICPTSATGIRIYVKCNCNFKNSTEIILNGNEICNTKTPEQYTFNNEKTAIGIIRKRRESSWTESIRKRPTISSGHGVSWHSYIQGNGATPSRPPAHHDSAPAYVTNQTGPGTWLSYLRGTQPAVPNQDECGKVAVANLHPLVINAIRTNPGEWPWQIALYKDGGFYCGGTLVSRQHVVTAAHCVTQKDSENLINREAFTVYLGKHNLRTSTEGVQQKNVEAITKHPQYRVATLSYDIAVLKLGSPVDFTDFVRPACLWSKYQVDLLHVIGKIGSVVGWGETENGTGSEELGLVNMRIATQDQCLKVNGKFDRDKIFCAGLRDGTTTCFGDSGGGLVLKIGDTWHLRGLVSAGIGHCDTTRYIFFTDVAKFLPWLTENLL